MDLRFCGSEEILASYENINVDKKRNIKKQYKDN